MEELFGPKTWRHRFVQWLAHVLGVSVYTHPAVIVIDMSKLPPASNTDNSPKVH